MTLVRMAKFHIRGVWATKVTTSGGTRTHNPRLRRPVPYPLGHRGFPELHHIIRIVISNNKFIKKSKFRGHPGLNQGPLDLQSNALPLSYIPLRLWIILMGIYHWLLFCLFHVLIDYSVALSNHSIPVEASYPE